MYGTVSASSPNKATSTVAVCACAAVFAVAGFVAVQPHAHYTPAAVRPAVQTTMTTIPAPRSFQANIVSATQMQSQSQQMESSVFSQIGAMSVPIFSLGFGAVAGALGGRLALKLFSSSGASPELFEKVRSIVIKELGIDEEKATPDANVQELGADSLDLVELIMKLEDTFGISIPEEVSMKITTIREQGCTGIFTKDYSHLATSLGHLR
eukprot:EG_transcript_22662